MRKVATAVLICISLLAHGQQSAPEAAASREDVLRLFEAMALKEQMGKLEETIKGQVKAMLEKDLNERRKDVPPERRAKFQEFMQVTIDESLKLYPMAEMLDDMAPVYQKHLTRAEVSAIIAFYQSPAGRKLVEKGPVMTEEAMAIVFPKMQERQRALRERMLKRTEELLGAPATEKPK